MLRNSSIQTRIMFVLCATLLLLVAGVFSFLMNSHAIRDAVIHTTEQKMLDGHKNEIQTATRTLAAALSRSLQNIETPEEQKAFIKSATEHITFGADNSGYYFAYQGTVPFSLPAKPSLEGKDLMSSTDKDGIFFVRELSKAAQSGGGFVHFTFKKPGAGNTPKLAYATPIPGSPFWIGTGVYLDTIEQEKIRLDTQLSDNVSEHLKSTLMILGAGLLLIIGFSIAVSKSIVGPIQRATVAAEAISDGNLDIKLNRIGTDEIAELERELMKMAQVLRSNMTEIQQKTQVAEEKARAAEDASAQAQEALDQARTARSEGMLTAANKLDTVVQKVIDASGRIATQSKEIQKGTENQRVSVASTATAVEEMSATVLEVARNATQAAEASHKAYSEALEGQTIVGEAIGAIEETRTKSNELNENMAELEEQAESIGTIMNVITDIADQTNLLALNAAIEAARAGEAGRGFAVVADEVRKLAEKTMAATRDVGSAIAAIQQVSNSNVQSMTEALRHLEEAVQLSGKSGEMLGGIVTAADDSAEQIRSIAAASEQQSTASDEINANIGNINNIAELNAEEVTASVTALRDLQSQTSELGHIINQLKDEAQNA
ncbi:methyl-accepting chemotaxis protein [Desulfobaculum bizertense]|uniref:methyl-accepting chemotaxis protein n=1 Tax=Desulfobaculum bizertense TaxID=376490 RepID=UPI001F46A5F7|nr:methyl-accepting chemotaxis protein [Desulfobaculum bizertense]UIJ38190.1 methyl-accepting chemotaxis protein [Desulfobaculum bizertense]